MNGQYNQGYNQSTVGSHCSVRALGDDGKDSKYRAIATCSTSNVMNYSCTELPELYAHAHSCNYNCILTGGVAIAICTTGPEIFSQDHND